MRENRIRDYILSLIYLMNTKVNIVEQGTVLGPVLNNCSIGDFPKSSCLYYFGSTEIKSLEFVEDIADLNDDMISAQICYKDMEICKIKKD